MEIIFGLLVMILILNVYAYIYFRSIEFNKIKESIKDNTIKCNELNDHIELLKNTYAYMKKIDY